MKHVGAHVQLQPIQAVKPIPANPYADQFDLYTALDKGTLFRWLYDPYHKKKC